MAETEETVEEVRAEVVVTVVLHFADQTEAKRSWTYAEARSNGVPTLPTKMPDWAELAKTVWESPSDPVTLAFAVKKGHEQEACDYFGIERPDDES